MEADGDSFVEAPSDPLTGAPPPVEITLEGVDVSVNSNGEFKFTFADTAPAMTIPPFMVGESGIVIDIERLQLIMSEETAAALPETIDATSRGVLLEEAAIHFPDGMSDILPEATLLFEDAFIGSGGFSGSVTLDLQEDEGVDDYDENNAKTVFGFGFTLQKLTVEFLQNTLTACDIIGFLKVPFFEEAVKITFGITNDGEITLALGAPDESGLFVLEKEDIISVEVSSLEFFGENNVYELKLSGKFRLAFI